MFVGSFISGTTEPSTSNIGHNTEQYAGLSRTSTTIGDGTGILQSAVAGEEWHDTDFIGRWKRGAAGQKLVNCTFSTPAVKPTWTQGNDYVMIDCSSTTGGTSGTATLVDHCSVIPNSKWVDLYGIKGGNMEILRSIVTGTTDGIMCWRWDTWVTDSLIYGLIRYEDDTPRHVDGTHNDGLQNQGGARLFIQGSKFDVEQPLLGSLLGTLTTADYANPLDVSITNNWYLGGSVPINYALDVISPQPVITITGNRIRLGQKDYGGGTPRAHIIIPSGSRLHANTTISGNVDYDNGTAAIVKNG